MLPYLLDRPQSMNRFPNGINAPGFYQKDVDVEKSPDWIQTHTVFAESTQENVDYLLCNNKETLLYMANLGCIEINPWNSRIKKIDKPDWLVIDLDPEKIDFIYVVEVANEVKKFLDSLEAESYCKTSGATGLHIFIPLGAKYNYDIVRKFAQVIAQNIHMLLPEITSIERSPKRRQGKVYIDYLQNSRGQTLAAPYSLRPKPGATISTPLEWKEVNKKLRPSDFTINNIRNRIDKKGDLWSPVTGKGINLQKIVKRLQEKNLNDIDHLSESGEINNPGNLEGINSTSFPLKLQLRRSKNK
jgi:bifunctional non-homologous end joining protein LigD